MKKRENCKILQTHRRLNEAHLLWHQADDNYFNPTGFITNINAAIQALRNLTFALQNEKKNIPGFDEWYKGWQDILKKDDIMRWLCEARTEIVHKKDLEISSEATVTIYSYKTVLKAKVNVPIFVCGKELLKYLLESEVIDKELVNKDVYASVERNWRVLEFPQHDVLYLIAYGIGILYTLLQEAHELTHISINACSICDSVHKLELSKNNLPLCMEDLMRNRNEIIDLSGFISRQFSYSKVSYDKKLERKVKSKYKKILSVDRKLSLCDPYEYAEQLMEMSKEILVKDGYHTCILWYRKGDLTWEIMQPTFMDQTSKFIFWQEFSKIVEQKDINAIIFISESWMGNLEEYVENGVRPSDQKNRLEVLITDVFVKGNKYISYTTIFNRSFYGKIKLENTEKNEIENGYRGYIMPVLKVWKKDIK